MAGKKSSAPTDVYVVVGRAMYDLSQITIQGVYVDQQAAMTAANDDAATVQQVPVNYSGANNTSNGDAEGKASTKTKTKPQTKASKTTSQSNGATASKESSKRKTIPDGEASSLAGMTLATSGTLSTLTRETFNETVEKFGGVHTNKFADATSIVLGTNPGTKKLEEIAEKSYDTVTEEDFYNMIGAEYVPPAKKAKKS